MKIQIGSISANRADLWINPMTAVRQKGSSVDYNSCKVLLRSTHQRQATHKDFTTLARDRKTQIAAREFNTVAIEKGYLCELERKSSYGQKKTFKSITEKGLAFGENQVNPNNPKSTQPLWYESKFDELLILLGFIHN